VCSKKIGELIFDPEFSRTGVIFCKYRFPDFSGNGKKIYRCYVYWEDGKYSWKDCKEIFRINKID
jgi:hypothetical protein